VNPVRAWRSRRAADLAQARRIAAACAEDDAAWRDLPWGACSPDGQSMVHVPRAEAGMRIARASGVLARAQANASPRAVMWAATLHRWGSLRPPSPRRQDQILAARNAARERRGDVMDEVRAGRLTRTEGDALLAGWQPHTHPRDPLRRTR
jgi:hypothetical protein